MGGVGGECDERAKGGLSYMSRRFIQLVRVW